MKCSQVRDSLPDYSVQLLDGRASREIEAHLQACASCRAELEAQEAVMALVEQHGALEPPVGLFNAVRNRIESGELERERPAWWSFLFSGPARVAAMGLAMAAVAFGLFAPAPHSGGPTAERSVVLPAPSSSGTDVALGDLRSSIRQHALSAGMGTLPDRVAWEAMAQLVAQEGITPEVIGPNKRREKQLGVQ